MTRTKKTARKSTAQQEADNTPSMAIVSEDAMKDNDARKTALDAKTLQIRFFEDFPKTADDIKELHSDIKFVRTQRMAGKAKDGISCAVVEFEDPEECKAAKNKLATTQYKGNEVYVDFVESSTAKGGLDPIRLFVCGLPEGIDERNLKEKFPKAAHVDIPSKSKKKGSSYGFVQFSNPGDAKAAFDAAQDLTINDFKITVLFAKQRKEARRANASFKKARKDEKELKVNKKDKKENEESTGEKRISTEETNETGVKKVKVEEGESKLDIEKEMLEKLEKGMRKEEFYFLYKKAMKSEKEAKVEAIDVEESNKKVKEEMKRAVMKAEKEAEKKYEEEPKKKSQKMKSN